MIDQSERTPLQMAADLLAIRQTVVTVLGDEYQAKQAPFESWVASTAAAMKSSALEAAAALAKDFTADGEPMMALRTLAAGVELSDTFRGTPQ